MRVERASRNRRLPQITNLPRLVNRQKDNGAECETKRELHD